MNFITSHSSHHRNRANGILSKPVNSVETAGSLAMAHTSLFSTNLYDVFTSSNPFIVDYSMYANIYGDAPQSGFFDSFFNAVSVIEAGAGASASCGAASSGGSCGGGCSGGFIC